MAALTYRDGPRWLVNCPVCSFGAIVAKHGSRLSLKCNVCEDGGAAALQQIDVDRVLAEIAGTTKGNSRRSSRPSGRPARKSEAKDGFTLPELPHHDDVAGLCRWLTVAFSLDPARPITGGMWHGLRGPDGHVALRRAGAREIRFEPVKAVNSPMRLIEALSWHRERGDGIVHALKGEHCRQIAHAIAALCDSSAALDAEGEAHAIVGTFIAGAQAVEGLTTYGTTQQRYEAALGLRREVDEHTGRPAGPARYLIDAQTGQRLDEETGELLDFGIEPDVVIAVSELADVARRFVGSSLPHGWLDGRMAAIGFERITVQGYAEAGRAGRLSHHARIYAYRGREHRNTQNDTPTRESEGAEHSAHARNTEGSCVPVFTGERAVA